MNNRASALILGLLVILVLAVLSSSFLYKQINEGFLSNRFADSARALWAAEAGIQSARNNNLDQTSLSGSIEGATYAVTISQISSSSSYMVVSTGTSGAVSRTVEAVVSTRETDASKFKYGIESTVDIDFKGSTTVYGETTDPNPPAKKYLDPNYYKENSTFSFPDLFIFTTTELKSWCADMGSIYNGTFPSAGFSGINWVMAPSSKYTGNVEGSGVLIIEGDLRIAGTINFSGIIYVIGELDISGTAVINGAILAESAANVDTTLTGTCDIIHSTAAITSALANIANLSPRIVSWKEIIQ